MNDLISRQAAIDALKRNTFRLTFAEEQNCEGHVAWSAEAVYSEVMEGVLLDLSPVQPENDIQYCKDCPEVQHEETLGYYFCVHRALTERIVQPDDYCSYPKRKKDGKEGA